MQQIKFVFLTVSFSCIPYMLGNCYILRLPCMIYGEFNIRYDNHFYQGVVEEMKTDLMEFDCSMSCINHASCKFYNYFKHNRTCSLLSSSINTITKEMLTPMADASFLSTNYSTYNRGPTCILKTPCHDDEICKEICTEPHFRCSRKATITTDKNDAANIPQTTSVTITVIPNSTNTTTKTDTTSTTTVTTSSTSTSTKIDTTSTITITASFTSTTTETDTTTTASSIPSLTTTTTLLTTTTTEASSTSTAIPPATIPEITSQGAPSQSTTDRIYEAERAVDGRNNTSARTQPTDIQPYFKLSFNNNFNIKYVELIYGSNNSNYFALHVLIEIDTSKPSASSGYCGATSSNYAANFETVTCSNGGKNGNRVFLTSTGPIKVNEIKVYGTNM